MSNNFIEKGKKICTELFFARMGYLNEP